MFEIPSTPEHDDGGVSMRQFPLMECLPAIERDLKPYDLISLGFILYESKELARRKLRIIHRTEDSDKLLCGWAEAAQKVRDTWKDEFLEALIVCQLYKVIKKLGLDVEIVKQTISLDNLHYLDPMKVTLYKLCESLDSTKLETLRNCLGSFKFQVDKAEPCEMIFLNLMISGHIIVNHGSIRNNIYKSPEYSVEWLTIIIERIPGLRIHSEKLRKVEKLAPVKVAELNLEDVRLPRIVADDVHPEDSIYTGNYYPVLDKMASLDIDKLEFEPDSIFQQDKGITGSYPIKDAKNVGACYVINQTYFYPSQESIKRNPNLKLDNRENSLIIDNSTIDAAMKALNMRPYFSKNIDHVLMMDNIKRFVNKMVDINDSVFMLYILSHGVKGYVYAADCVKVSVEDIKFLVADILHDRGIDIPVVYVIQACQGEEKVSSPVSLETLKNLSIASNEQVSDNSDTVMIEDGVTSSCDVNVLKEENILTHIHDGPEAVARHADYILCWATSPTLKAYRVYNKQLDKSEGSIFIKIFCQTLVQFADRAHLLDIVTLVNQHISNYFKKYPNTDQVSCETYSMTKRLYLKPQKKF